MEVVRERKEKKIVLKDIFQMKLKGGEQMRSMLNCFPRAWKIFLVVIPSMTGGTLSPIKWWVVHGTSAPMLQSIALKLL